MTTFPKLQDDWTYKPVPLEDANRVEVTRPFHGIARMQVCAVEDATDEEILKVCNSENHAGTRNGWMVVNRDTVGSCQDYPGRIHLLIDC